MAPAPEIIASLSLLTVKLLFVLSTNVLLRSGFSRLFKIVPVTSLMHPVPNVRYGLSVAVAIRLFLIVCPASAVPQVL